MTPYAICQFESQDHSPWFLLCTTNHDKTRSQTLSLSRIIFSPENQKNVPNEPDHRFCPQTIPFLYTNLILTETQISLLKHFSLFTIHFTPFLLTQSDIWLFIHQPIATLCIRNPEFPCFSFFLIISLVVLPAPNGKNHKSSISLLWTTSACLWRAQTASVHIPPQHTRHLQWAHETDAWFPTP